MEKLIHGLHHLTAISSSGQQTLDFYSGVLGLRLVKKTVNFDASGIYHLYFGDDEANPGSLLTFFPYEGLVNGRQGKGMINTTGLSVPSNAAGFWLERLKRFGIAFTQPKERFERESVVYFEDPDGLGLELVFNDRDLRKGRKQGPIPESYSIRGLFHTEMVVETPERTAGLLTHLMDHELISQSGNRFRYATLDAPGHYVDLLTNVEALKGLAGSGTVHHLAFATGSLGNLEQWWNKVRGLHPTEIKDRKYFSSVYLREPGGILFEVATRGPGFTVDESMEALGTSLQLPAWFEGDRAQLSQSLKELKLNPEKFI